MIIGVAAASPAAAVANGIAAAPGQDPFAVRLTMSHIPRADGTFYDSACSAALISPTWIITAGHCFHDINRHPISGPVPYPTTATLDTNNINTNPGETRSVVTVQQSTSTDVALAQLSAPITDVTPLAIARTRPSAGTIVTLAGWDATSDINAVPSSSLNLGQVKPVNQERACSTTTGLSAAILRTSKARLTEVAFEFGTPTEMTSAFDSDSGLPRTSL